MPLPWQILPKIKLKNRKGTGAGIGTKSYRAAMYPILWIYNKAVKSKPVDSVKIMNKHLPEFYIIPKNRETEILPYVRKHVLTLKDGKKVVALKDMQNCRDSRSWFAKQKSTLEKDLTLMKYSRELIEEMDVKSDSEFGRFLKHQWDSAITRGQEEIVFQQKIRGKQ